MPQRPGDRDSSNGRSADARRHPDLPMRLHQLRGQRRHLAAQAYHRGRPASNATLNGVIFHPQARRQARVDHRRHEQHRSRSASGPTASSTVATRSAGTGGPRATTATRSSRTTLADESHSPGTDFQATITPPTTPVERRLRRVCGLGLELPPRRLQLRLRRRLGQVPQGHDRYLAPRPEHRRADQRTRRGRPRPLLRRSRVRRSASTRRSRPATAARSSARTRIDRDHKRSIHTAGAGDRSPAPVFLRPDSSDSDGLPGDRIGALLRGDRTRSVAVALYIRT